VPPPLISNAFFGPLRAQIGLLGPTAHAFGPRLGPNLSAPGSPSLYSASTAIRTTASLAGYWRPPPPTGVVAADTRCIDDIAVRLLRDHSGGTRRSHDAETSGPTYRRR
jgi:hypothetical protein